MYRENFTTDEWRTLQFAPLWVLTAVGSADGKVDQQEIGALAKELAEWLQFKDSLVQELLLSVGQELQSLMRLYAADTRNVFTGLQQVADLLDRKATAEQAKAVKGSLLLIGRNIAEASGGGFLQKKGKISSEEQNALVAIFVALRATP